MGATSTLAIALAVVCGCMCHQALADGGDQLIAGSAGLGCTLKWDKASCMKEKGCVWCKTIMGSGTCYGKAEAKLLPSTFYTCKKTKSSEAFDSTDSTTTTATVSSGSPPGPPGPPGPTPGAGCSTAMDKKACGKEKGCLWCESGFGPASCYSKDQAKYLPKQFFKCKKPKKASGAEVEAVVTSYAVSSGSPPGPPGPPGPTPGAGCSTAMDKKACGKEKGCLWCESGFGPASCYSEDQAKYLPKQFFKCKKPKKASGAELEAVVTSYAVSSGSPPGPPGPPGPTPGAGCSSAMDKKACGKEKGCLWCEGKFGPASCYSKDQAKFLPAQFYKCKKPKAANSLTVAAA